MVAFEERVYFNKGLFIVWKNGASIAIHCVPPEGRTPENTYNHIHGKEFGATILLVGLCSKPNLI